MEQFLVLQGERVKFPDPHLGTEIAPSANLCFTQISKVWSILIRVLI